METAEPLRIEKDMLPGIRAVVLRRKIWASVGSLAAWGILNLLLWLPAWEEDQKLLDSIPDVPMLLYVLLYGVAVIGATMLVMAIVGALRPRSSVIALDASAVALVGAWNAAWPFVAMVVGRKLGFKVEFDSTWLVLGICQLAWSFRQWRTYREVSGWAPQVAGVGPEEYGRIKKHLSAFVKQDEDYFAGRIAGFVSDRGFLTPGVRKGFRGQVLDDVMILVSKRLDECLRVRWEDAASATYSGAHPRTRVMTEGGLKLLTLGALSVLAVKQWAGLPPTEKDIQRIVKKKKASARLLAMLLGRDDPTFHLIVLGAVGRLRGDPEAPAVAQSRLDDPLGSVRAAAIDACRALRVAGLDGRAIPMLADGEAVARKAAGAYLAAFPVAAACGPLRSAMQHEQDPAVARQMAKAVKACEADGANPYAGL